MGRTITESLKAINQHIDNYVPPTKWEANNHRTLKYLHTIRASLEKALEKEKDRNNDRIRRKQKENDEILRNLQAGN